MTIRFLLNDQEICTNDPSGQVVLDYLRKRKKLYGTKIGCREGDCGACSVLIGDLVDGQLRYRSMTSCLLPLGNVAGKHVVSIEGLNVADLTPVQQAIVDEGGTQCGFCTVGFVVSLAGFCMSKKQPSYEGAIAAMDGNICRCTGYKSLERAAATIVKALTERDDAQHFQWLIDNNWLPKYFAQIPERLAKLAEELPPRDGSQFVAGGTDLFVQRPEEMRETSIAHLFDRRDLIGLCKDGARVQVGCGTTAADLQVHPLMNQLFPKMPAYMKLVSSTQIRNMGTLGGNLVNASPIGDLSIFFQALEAKVHLRKGEETRVVALKDFYLGYKQLDKTSDEILVALSFDAPEAQSYFNFEKVSKRTHLDIASVNAAMMITLKDGKISRAGLSAGGVGPTPMFLKEASAYLLGKAVTVETVAEAAKIACAEVSPIGDARGTKEYKRLLLRQLIYAHFLENFPEQIQLEALV